MAYPDDYVIISMTTVRTLRDHAAHFANMYANVGGPTWAKHYNELQLCVAELDDAIDRKKRADSDKKRSA